MNLYRYIPVFRREPHGAKLYRCFELLGAGGFVVQSADYFIPNASREHTLQMEDQFLELFLEQSPEERVAPMPSIEEAIQCFDAAFSQAS